jgi:hypothetical protein
MFDDGGCIFIDSTTGFIHLVLQVNLNTHETLNAIMSLSKCAMSIKLYLKHTIPTMLQSLHLKA